MEDPHNDLLCGNENKQPTTVCNHMVHRHKWWTKAIQTQREHVVIIHSPKYKSRRNPDMVLEFRIAVTLWGKMVEVIEKMGGSWSTDNFLYFFLEANYLSVFCL